MEFTPTHDDPVLKLLDADGAGILSFPIAREAWIACANSGAAIQIPDDDKFGELAGARLSWESVAKVEVDPEITKIVVTLGPEISTLPLKAAAGETGDRGDDRGDPLPDPPAAAKPAKPAAIMGLALMDALHASGVIPENCRRVVIEATAGEGVKIYFDCIGDVRLLSVFRASLQTPAPAVAITRSQIEGSTDEVNSQERESTQSV